MMSNGEMSNGEMSEPLKNIDQLEYLRTADQAIRIGHLQRLCTELLPPLHVIDFDMADFDTAHLVTHSLEPIISELCREKSKVDVAMHYSNRLWRTRRRVSVLYDLLRQEPAENGMFDYGCRITRRAPTEADVSAQLRHEPHMLFIFHNTSTTLPTTLLYTQHRIGVDLLSRFYCKIKLNRLSTPKALRVIENVAVVRNMQLIEWTEVVGEIFAGEFFVDRVLNVGYCVELSCRLNLAKPLPGATAYARHTKNFLPPTPAQQNASTTTSNNKGIRYFSDNHASVHVRHSGERVLSAPNIDDGDEATEESDWQWSLDSSVLEEVVVDAHKKNAYAERVYGDERRETTLNEHVYSDRLASDTETRCRLGRRLTQCVTAAYELYRCIGGDTLNHSLTHADLFYLLQLMHVERSMLDDEPQPLRSQDPGRNCVVDTTILRERIVAATPELRLAARRVSMLPFVFLMQQRDARFRTEFSVGMAYGALHGDRKVAETCASLFNNYDFGALLNKTQMLGWPRQKSQVAAVVRCERVDMARVHAFVETNALVGDAVRLKRLENTLDAALRVPLNTDRNVRGALLSGWRAKNAHQWLANRITPNALNASVRNIVPSARDGVDYVIIYSPMSYVSTDDARYSHCVDPNGMMEKYSVIAESVGSFGVAKSAKDQRLALIAAAAVAERAPLVVCDAMETVSTASAHQPQYTVVQISKNTVKSVQSGNFESFDATAANKFDHRRRKTNDDNNKVEGVNAKKRGRPRKADVDESQPTRARGRPRRDSEIKVSEEIQKRSQETTVETTFAEPALYVCGSAKLMRALEDGVAPLALLTRATKHPLLAVDIPLSGPATAALMANADAHELSSVCHALNAVNALLGASPFEWNATSERAQRDAVWTSKALARVAQAYGCEDVCAFVGNEIVAPIHKNLAHEIDRTRELLNDSRRRAMNRRALKRHNRPSLNESQLQIEIRGLYAAMSALLGSSVLPVLCNVDDLQLFELLCTDATVLAHLREVRKRSEEMRKVKNTIPPWFTARQQADVHVLDGGVVVEKEEESRSEYERHHFDDAAKIIAIRPNRYATVCACGSTTLQECAGMALRVRNHFNLEHDDSESEGDEMKISPLCCLCATSTPIYDNAAITAETHLANPADGVLVGVCNYCRLRTSAAQITKNAAVDIDGVRQRSERGHVVAGRTDLCLIDWSATCELVRPNSDRVSLAQLLSHVLDNLAADDDPYMGLAMRNVFSTLTLRFRVWHLAPLLPSQSQLRKYKRADGDLCSNYWKHLDDVEEPREQTLVRWMDAMAKGSEREKGVMGAKVSIELEQILRKSLQLQTPLSITHRVDVSESFYLAVVLSALEMMVFVPGKSVNELFLILDKRSHQYRHLVANPAEVVTKKGVDRDELLARCVREYKHAMRGFCDFLAPLRTVEEYAQYLHAWRADVDGKHFALIDCPLARSSEIGGDLVSSPVNDWHTDLSERIENVLSKGRIVRPFTNAMCFDDAFLNFYS